MHFDELMHFCDMYTFEALTSTDCVVFDR